MAVTSDAVLTQGEEEVVGDTTVDPGQIVLISYGRSCSDGTCGDIIDIYVHRAGLETAEAAVCLGGAAGDQELRDAARALRPLALPEGSLPPAPAKVRVTFRECTIIH